MSKVTSEQELFDAVQHTYLRLYSAVLTLDGARANKVNVATEEDRQACVLPVMVRTAFLMCFQERQWFTWRGRTDYVAALCEDTRSGMSGYLFTQRLARIFDNATRQPLAAARDLVKPLVGVVPYLGPNVLGSLNPALDDQPLMVLEDEAVLEACGPTGIYMRHTFTLDGQDGTVGPDQFVGALLRALGRKPAEPDRTLALQCRDAICCELGEPEFDQMDEDAARRTLQAIARVHMVEDSCGPGDKLVAYVDALASLVRPLVHRANLEEDEDVASVVANLVGQNMRGVDADPVNVYLARFRLACRLLALSDGEKPAPLPAMDTVVQTGGLIAGGKSTATSNVGFTEGPRTEFKSTFEWDSRREQRNPEHQVASLKTIAAFMNAHGGVLYLGVDDEGHAIGLEGDLSLINDPHPLDIFEMRFREAMKNHIQPIPLNFVQLQFLSVEGKTVAKVEVTARQGVTYVVRRDLKTGAMLEEVYVRDGNRTLNLAGRSRDQFILGRYGVGNMG